MSSAPAQLAAPVKSRLRGTTIAVVAIVAFATLFLLTTATEFVADENTTTVILAALVFFGLLVFAAAYGRASSQPAKWLIFVVWWGLLVSEEVFSYRSDIAGGAGFASQAYDQGILWIVALLGLLILVLKYPESLRGLFQGDYKWVSWITLVSIVSCVYSPNPAFSFAWAFKLTLVVLVMHICFQQINGMAELRDFLNITVFGFFFWFWRRHCARFLRPIRSENMDRERSNNAFAKLPPRSRELPACWRFCVCCFTRRASAVGR